MPEYRHACHSVVISTLEPMLFCRLLASLVRNT